MDGGKMSCAKLQLKKKLKIWPNVSGHFWVVVIQMLMFLSFYLVQNKQKRSNPMKVSVGRPAMLSRSLSWESRHCPSPFCPPSLSMPLLWCRAAPPPQNAQPGPDFAQASPILLVPELEGP